MIGLVTILMFVLLIGTNKADILECDSAGSSGVDWYAATDRYQRPQLIRKDDIYIPGTSNTILSLDRGKELQIKAGADPSNVILVCTANGSTSFLDWYCLNNKCSGVSLLLENFKQQCYLPSGHELILNGTLVHQLTGKRCLWDGQIQDADLRVNKRGHYWCRNHKTGQAILDVEVTSESSSKSIFCQEAEASMYRILSGVGTAHGGIWMLILLIWISYLLT